MMNEFKQECTIILAVSARGKKVSWAGKLLNENGECLVLAKKFMGFASHEDAEKAALEFGMEQALRLRQEKVELQTSFRCDHILSETNLRGRKKNTESPIRDLWNGFRLKRYRLITGEEQRELQHEIEQEFLAKAN